MMPRQFRWKRNHGCELPSNLMIISTSVDTPRNDDDGEDAGPMYIFNSVYAICCRRNGKKWYGWKEQCHDRIDDLWGQIYSRCRPKEPLHIYAYDWTTQAQLIGLWDQFDQGLIHLTLPERIVTDDEGGERKIKEWQGMALIDRKPFALYAVSRYGTIKFIDVCNYFDVPITELCRSFDRPLPNNGKFGCRSIGDRTFAQQSAWGIANCITRTLTTWRENDEGNWQPTTGRLAWSNWRHKFMDQMGGGIDNDRIDRQWERKGYFGGETRCFAIGRVHGPIHKVDISGLYPAVMLSGVFPIGLGNVWDKPRAMGHDLLVCAAHSYAEIEVDCQGIVPVRGGGMEVTYPREVRTTYLCSSELDRAAQEGRIKYVHRWQEYRCAPIFAEYVEYWKTKRWEAKVTQNAALDALSKLMLNSLYGYFARWKQTWRTSSYANPPIRWGHFVGYDRISMQWKKYRAIAGLVQEHHQREEREDTWPIISAFVTSSAREYMRRIREQLPPPSVLAQQTDCFYLTQDGYEKLQSMDCWGPNQFGKFRLVDTFKYVDFNAKGIIITDTNMFIPGLPQDSERIGPNQFKGWQPSTSLDAFHGRSIPGTVRIKENIYDYTRSCNRIE